MANSFMDRLAADLGGLGFGSGIRVIAEGAYQLGVEDGRQEAAAGPTVGKAPEGAKPPADAKPQQWMDRGGRLHDSKAACDYSNGLDGLTGTKPQPRASVEFEARPATGFEGASPEWSAGYDAGSQARFDEMKPLYDKLARAEQYLKKDLEQAYNERDALADDRNRAEAERDKIKHDLADAELKCDKWAEEVYSLQRQLKAQTQAREAVDRKLTSVLKLLEIARNI